MVTFGKPSMPTMFGASQPRMLGSIFDAPYSTFWSAAALASAAISGYHGVKRHRGSVGWGVAWFTLGAVFPILTPVVALAQGYAKPEK